METIETDVITGKTTRENRKIEKIYERAFPRVAAFVGNLGGSFDDAKDIFHDALVIYIEAVTKTSSIPIASEGAYIFGISKHLWIRKHKRERINIPLSKMEKEISVPDDYYTNAEDNRLLRILEKAGKKCMDLLRAFYYQNIPVKKLAGTLGYASEHSASVQKYKCLEKIRNTVKEKSLSYEDLTE